MRAELLERLRTVMRGAHNVKTSVTPATPVTDGTGYRPEPPELQALRRLQVKDGKKRRGDFSPVTAPATALLESDEAAIEERAGLAAGRVPPVYLDAWARLNHQRPYGMSEGEWRQALDDGGRFLDALGNEAAELRWTPGELFDVRAGLVWRLAGERVEAIGADHVRLGDRRTLRRANMRKWHG